MKRILFLLGGPAFETAAKEFIPAAGGKGARIALLLMGGYKKEYLPDYTGPWKKRGISKYHLVSPEKDGKLDMQDVSAKIEEATGIFIGGGDTPQYHKLYATEPMRCILREKYDQGIPFVGLSAGALIVLEHCVIGLRRKEKPAEILDGLGLIKGIIIGTHFSERNVLPAMLEAMANTKTMKGWGINETACAVFENEKFVRVLGGSVCEIEITDFQKRSYDVSEHSAM